MKKIAHLQHKMRRPSILYEKKNYKEKTSWKKPTLVFQLLANFGAVCNKKNTKNKKKEAV